MSRLTQRINSSNVENVRKMIMEKQTSCPFYATTNDASSVITDFDHFPYTRFYRGVYYSDKPIALEREAGYRPHHDGCYNMQRCQPVENNPPNLCFQFPCSVLFPCNLDNGNTPESHGLAPFIKCISSYR